MVQTLLQPTIVGNGPGKTFRDAINASYFKSAESFGFVKGAGNAATNLTAWNALMASGGDAFVYFSAGDWDMQFATNPSLLNNANLVIKGSGGKRTRFLIAAGIRYMDLAAFDNVIVEGIYFYGGAVPQTSGFIVVAGGNKTRDCGDLIFRNNIFENTNTAFRSDTTATEQFVIDRFIVINNKCFNRNGLARVMRTRCRYVHYERNHVDGKIGVPYGGPAAAYGGIIHGYVQDGSNQSGALSAEEIGEAHFINNTIRNIKPGSDPGSSGVYGIQSQAYSNVFMGNRIEKVYPFKFGGTARVAEALGTGDGTTLAFSGTLANDITPDTLVIKIAGAAVADDDDRGWAHGGWTGINVGSEPNTNQWGSARQKIVWQATNAVIGWVDYNSKAWSVTFPAGSAPANGAAITADYYTGVSVSNIEGLYAKSGYDKIIGNTIQDCSGNQGMLAPKGGGSYGYENYGVLAWQGGGGAQHTCIIMGNTLRNRVQTTVFNLSEGIWCQQDRVICIGNTFEGISNRVFRSHGAGYGSRQLIFKNNIVKDHYGSTIVFLGTNYDSVEVEVNVDGWWGTDTTEVSRSLNCIRASTSTVIVKSLVVGNIIVSERCGAGRTVAIVGATSTTGYFDTIVKGIVKMGVSWYGYQKSGSGAGGRFALTNHSYCNDNFLGIRSLLSGGTQITNETLGTAVA